MNCDNCPKSPICPVPKAEEFLAAHPDEENEQFEGMRMVCEELLRLIDNQFPSKMACLITAMQIGYAMGRMYEPIPKVWKNM